MIKEILANGYFWYIDNNFFQNTTNFVLVALSCAVIAYLCGSLNFSVMISKMRYGIDIRTEGSHNAGATNMYRMHGKKAATLTFLGDFLKTALAVGIGYFMGGYNGAYLAGLFCVVGHAYPIYFKFKGGKGVVAISTMCLLTNPIVFLVMLLIFAIILFGYKMVSLASIMCMIVYPMILSSIGGMISNPDGSLVHYGPHILIATITALFVIFLHRTNIARIYNHTESKISFGNKKEKAKKSYKEDDE